MGASVMRCEGRDKGPAAAHCTLATQPLCVRRDLHTYLWCIDSLFLQH